MQSRLAFHIALWLVIAASTYGFIVNAIDAAYKLEHFGADLTHPSDYYAEGCLILAFVAGIAMFLSRIPSTPPRYRRTSTGEAWFDIRPEERLRRIAPAKPRRRAG